MMHRLQKYALVAEIIGAIAIVSSLLFVGIQIRQNSLISEVNAYQELIAQISLSNTLKIENPQFAALNQRFIAGGQPQSDSEYGQLESFLYMTYRHGDLAYRQYENGLIDEISLLSVLAPVRGYSNTEMGQNLWSFLSQNLNPDYVEYVEKVGFFCEEFTGTGATCITGTDNATP